MKVKYMFLLNARPTRVSEMTIYDENVFSLGKNEGFFLIEKKGLHTEKTERYACVSSSSERIIRSIDSTDSFIQCSLGERNNG